MARKSRRKSAKGRSGVGGLLAHWLALPVGLLLVVGAVVAVLSQRSEDAVARTKSRPSTSGVSAAGADSHEHDHIGDESRQQLVDILRAADEED